MIKRSEIINIDANKAISIEAIKPYFKSLYIYYKAYYNCEPILMVTSVFNACSYGKIVPSNEFIEAMYEFTQDEEYQELIGFQSKYLKDFINIKRYENR